MENTTENEGAEVATEQPQEVSKVDRLALAVEAFNREHNIEESTEEAEVEAAAEEEVIEEAEVKKDNRTFAEMRLEQKRLREEQQKAAQYNTELEEAKHYREEFAQLQQVAKSNPSALFEKFGLNVADVVKHSLISQGILDEEDKKVNDPRVDEVLKWKEEIEQNLIEQEEKLLFEKQSVLINNYKQELRDVINNNEQFELLQTYDEEGIETVWNLIIEEFNTRGVVPTYEEAAQVIEEHLVEQEKQRIIKLKSTKKLANIFGQEEKIQPSLRGGAVESKTLSNQHSEHSQVKSTTSAVEGQEGRMQRIISQMNSQ